MNNGKRLIPDLDVDLIPATPEEIERELNEDPDITLITDYLIGYLSPEDHAAVEHRLDNDRDFHERVAPIMMAWSVGYNNHDAAPAVDESPKIQDAAPSWFNRSRQRQLRRWQLAATLMFTTLLSTGGWLWLSVRPELTAPQVIVAEAPEREGRTVILAPNSTVRLTDASTLTYPDRPDGNDILRLKLEGSAYFDLESRHAGQYMIYTPSAEIIVTGTKFTVQVTDPGTTRIAVTEGTVVAASRGMENHEPLRLNAGQTAIVMYGQFPRIAR